MLLGYSMVDHPMRVKSKILNFQVYAMVITHQHEKILKI